jgi:hypothetical protein
MGKGTKQRTKKLGLALDEYESALNAYDGELAQIDADKREIEFERRAGTNVTNMKALLLQRVTVVLPRERDKKNEKLKKLQDAYKDLVTYFASKKPKKQVNAKYDAMRLLIDKVKLTGAVEV